MKKLIHCKLYSDLNHGNLLMCLCQIHSYFPCPF